MIYLDRVHLTSTSWILTFIIVPMVIAIISVDELWLTRLDWTRAKVDRLTVTLPCGCCCSPLVLDAVEGLTNRLSLVGEFATPPFQEVCENIQSEQMAYSGHVR